jgi:hypothetical protein
MPMKIIGFIVLGLLILIYALRIGESSSDERKDMYINTVDNPSLKVNTILPHIDTEVPPKTETATFAMG